MSGGIDISEKNGYIRISLYITFALKLSVNLWRSFSCVCCILTGIDTFPHALEFSSLLAFESFRPLRVPPSWLSCACIAVSVLFQHHDVYNKLLAPGCDLSVLYSIDWKKIINHDFGIRKKTFLFALRASSKAVCHSAIPPVHLHLQPLGLFKARRVLLEEWMLCPHKCLP